MTPAVHAGSSRPPSVTGPKALMAAVTTAHAGDDEPQLRAHARARLRGASPASAARLAASTGMPGRRERHERERDERAAERDEPRAPVGHLRAQQREEERRVDGVEAERCRCRRGRRRRTRRSPSRATQPTYCGAVAPNRNQRSKRPSPRARHRPRRVDDRLALRARASSQPPGSDGASATPIGRKREFISAAAADRRADARRRRRGSRPRRTAPIPRTRSPT